ncbi:glycosyltransferase family 9 protein [Aquirufa ecclesiirivi]|uniref:Glycosyltransferase family 9 protein n=1 Tax=Aquirufa ecclesiirivi TaxID=2715124 RepID=A0ABT4JEB9_9BACT|nr:glycosyltransferase family 9 protein [Aquirufa ecclesiirivi]MCZ2474568.1 glycosyltransferase family 9 protein [Aquirufa ecclesiirivi]
MFHRVTYAIGSLAYFLSLSCRILFKRLFQPTKVHIGILMDGDLGDMVASEPILGALQQKFGNVAIYWITEKRYFPLFSQHPLITELLDEYSLLVARFLLSWNPFTHFYFLQLSDFRIDPVFQISLQNEKADALGIRLNNYYHQYNLLEISSQLADLGRMKGQPHLYVDDQVLRFDLPKTYWLVHCKSNAGLRDWKDEHWQRLILDAISTWGVHVVEIGMKHPLKLEHPQFTSLVGQCNLMETMKIIQGASFFIGLDSGPTHMANAFQIPGLVICGEFTYFKKYMSYSGFYQESKQTKVMFNPVGRADGLGYDEVWQQLVALQENK